MIKSIREKTADILSVAPDRIASLPRVIISGRSEVLLECHKGIVLYRADKLIAATSEGCISVCGEKLILKELRKDMLLVQGRIRGVTYEN